MSLHPNTQINICFITFQTFHMLVQQGTMKHTDYLMKVLSLFNDSISITWLLQHRMTGRL